MIFKLGRVLFKLRIDDVPSIFDIPNPPPAIHSRRIIKKTLKKGKVLFKYNTNINNNIFSSSHFFRRYRLLQ